MKTNIILAGVGGQGILTIAEIIAKAALNQNLNIKQSEIHGMAQRGGAVQAHIRISDDVIYANVIPKGTADIIISIEPLETLRYLPWLKKDGIIISNDRPLENIPNYPDLDGIYDEIKKVPNAVIVNAKEQAANNGMAQAVNIALLGVASSYIKQLSRESFENAIVEKFQSKGEDVVNGNLKVFNCC